MLRICTSPRPTNREENQFSALKSRTFKVQGTMAHLDKTCKHMHSIEHVKMTIVL